MVARAAASECECSAAVGHDSRECGLCLFTFLPFVDCDVAADVLATPLVEGEAAVSYLSKGYTADLRAENLRGPPVR